MEKMIGAFYQCYKNKKAVDYVLSKYTENYPNSDVVLISDGGDDYKDIAEKYNCKYFFEENLNTGSQRALVFNNVESIIKYIDRISKYINLINAKYFLNLEDDVIVFKKTDHNELIYDINGCNFNEFLSPKLEKILKNYNSNLISLNKIYFGGCGGCFFNIDFFKQITKDKQKLKIDIEEFFYNSAYGEPAADRVFSFLCYKNQGTIGQYKGFCETWHPDYETRKLNNSIEVLHQYKELYE